MTKQEIKVFDAAFFNILKKSRKKLVNLDNDGNHHVMVKLSDVTAHLGEFVDFVKSKKKVKNGK